MVCTNGRRSVRLVGGLYEWVGMYEWYDVSVNGGRSVRVVADLCEW